MHTTFIVIIFVIRKNMYQASLLQIKKKMDYKTNPKFAKHNKNIAK